MKTFLTLLEQSCTALGYLTLLVLFLFMLPGCAQDLGGITKLEYDAETGNVSYQSGKEAGVIKAKQEIKPDGTRLVEVEAGDVKAFEGQAIQAQRISAQTSAIVSAIESLLPSMINSALCGAGIATACPASP